MWNPLFHFYIIKINVALCYHTLSVSQALNEGRQLIVQVASENFQNNLHVIVGSIDDGNMFHFSRFIMLHFVDGLNLHRCLHSFTLL